MNPPGYRLRNLRKDKGMTQTQFASLIGISQTFLSDLENNNSLMTEVVLNSIEYKIGVNKEWVKTGKGGKFLYLVSSDREGVVSEPEFDVDLQHIASALQKIPTKCRPEISKNVVSFIELFGRFIKRN